MTPEEILKLANRVIYGDAWHGRHLGTYNRLLAHEVVRLNTALDRLRPLPPEWGESVNSAKGLCDSEANRWATHSPKTSEHWRRVAIHLGALFLTQDFIGVASRGEVVKPLSGQPCGCDPASNWTCERHSTMPLEHK